MLHSLLLLFFFVSIFLIQPGEEFVEFFFLLDALIFIGYSSKGLIILCNCFDCPNGQANEGTYVGCRLGGFVLPSPLLRIVGILVFRQPTKS